MDFLDALKVVLRFEGGYVNDPLDPGGATNYGITQRTYDAWRRHGLVVRSVKDIEESEVAIIYRTNYWKPTFCDDLPYPIALMAFDTAVQWGVHGAHELLAPVPVHTDSCEKAIQQIYEIRKNFRYARVKKNPLQLKFLKGWLNRDAALRDAALAALKSQRAT